MKAVRIGRESEYVRISLAEPRAGGNANDRNALSDYFDSNWVSATIDISAGGFRGSCQANLERFDFPRLRDAITWPSSFESNCAEFSTIEGHLHLVIRGDRRGNFEASGIAKDRTDGNILGFKLKFDQTDLPRIQHELDRLIEAFPVLGKPRG